MRRRTRWFAAIFRSAARGPSALVGIRRFHDAVRFALPQRHAIAAIIGLTIAVAAINAMEPLIVAFGRSSVAMEFRGQLLVKARCREEYQVQAQARPVEQLQLPLERDHEQA